MDTSTQKHRIEIHIHDTYGAPAEHLWAQYPDYAVFRHTHSRKWFAAVMEIPAARLSLDCEKNVQIINLKCGPLLLGSLLSEPGFFRAYHMNKNNWVSVLLDDTVPDEKLCSLLALSYDSAASKRSVRRPTAQDPNPK